MNKHKLKCLFGHHEYTVPRKRDLNEYNVGILMCKHCQKAGRCLSDHPITWWFDYNEEGNLIHRKNSRGFEDWYKYNKRGYKTHEIDINGHETWYEHDEKGNLRYRKNSYGHRWWFNEKGVCLLHENTLVQ